MPECDNPRPETGGELQRVLEAERAGEPFIMLRDAAGTHTLALLAGLAQATVGRGPEHVLALDWDEEVSRAHAELRRLGSEWVIADDGLSTNGTFVNGERVTSARRLRDGDILRFARTSAIFRAPDERKATAKAGTSGVPEVGELTVIQREVLNALCRPLAAGRTTPATNPQIAAEVFLSVDAVKDHLRALYRKFGLTALPQFEKRARLADEALRWGLVSERDLRARGTTP